MKLLQNIQVLILVETVKCRTSLSRENSTKIVSIKRSTMNTMLIVINKHTNKQNNPIMEVSGSKITTSCSSVGPLDHLNDFI